MKTLTLIVATGATLALLAPTAGARNTLHCATTNQQVVHVRTTDPEIGRRFEVARNMQYFGTWRPALTPTTCKTLQSAKGAAQKAPSIRFQADRDSL